MSNVCFVTVGNEEFASSRMRGYWIARQIGAAVVSWDEMEKGEALPDSDIYIFQKRVIPELIGYLHSLGKQVWWDVCDPLWWFQPDLSKEIAGMVDGIVASNHGLANDCAEWSGRKVHSIPDCLDMAHFTVQREHTETTPVRLIWYGIAANRMALHAAAVNLARLVQNGYKIELTIFDDVPGRPADEVEGMCRVYYKPWRLADENETLAAHDIALLPPYPGPWGQVKSNNKRLTAHACGLPVTTGECYGGLAGLVADASIRRDQAAIGKELLANFTIDRAAGDWQRLLGL